MTELTTSRRDFLRTLATSAAGARYALGTPAMYPNGMRAHQANEKVRVGIIGAGGRGGSLAASFARLAGAEVGYVCDVDSRRRDEVVAKVTQAQGKAPRGVTDLRRALDDRDLDAVVIATPNHWHTPASVLALSAGKHVYVEKPGSHNAAESEMIVRAARASGRRVQMGNQRRSWPKVMEGIERVRGGAIGPVHHARGWYANSRDSIGRGKPAPVPEWLDYELWQGPAPRRPYLDNILNYNWHWFWHWGTGEIGNNGVHALDLCRWGLGVDHPVRVTSAGGRYFWDDDQETADTHMVTLEFPGEKSILWEGLSSNRHGVGGNGFGASFHGEGGTIVTDGVGYRLLDRAGKVVEEVSGSQAGQQIGVTGPGADLDSIHLRNFIAAVQTGEPLRAPIEDGQKSTRLCHLGNIALRTGRVLTTDPSTGRILDDAEATRLWGREYAPGWEPKV